MLHVLQIRRVDRAFAGRPSARAAQGMRRHLAGCEICRGRYERHVMAEAALPDGEARAAERLWQEITTVAAATGRERSPWLLAAVLAAASVIVMLGVRLREGPEDGRLVARGPSSAEPGLATPALHVFRALPGGAAEPAPARLAPTDGLLFAYSNPGAAYSRLMVFAVDEQQRVYWYYPAYQQAGQDPPAVPIERGSAGVELREVIHHPLPAGRVRLFALFLPADEHVLAVEAAVAAAYGPGRASLAEETSLGLPGAHQESRLFEVQP
jgi:hypothetical protein